MVEEQSSGDTRSVQNSTSSAETRKPRGKRQRTNKKRKNGTFKGKNATNNKFAGSESGMRGHVFQCKEESKSSLQFGKTCKELVRFVSSTYTQHEDIVHMIEKMEEPKIPEPPSPKATFVKDENDPKKILQLDPSWKERHKYSKLYDMYLERSEEYRLNKSALFQLIWGQCLNALKTKVKATPNFKQIHKNKQCIELLQSIQGVMHRFETQDYLPLGLKKAVVNYYLCKQGKREECDSYLLRFKSNMDVLSHYGGRIDPFRTVVHQEMVKANYTIDEDVHVPGNSRYNNYTDDAKEREAAIVFLDNSCDERFGQLKIDLANQYARKNNQYPNTLAEAYSMICHYVPQQSLNRIKTVKNDINDHHEESEEDDDTKKLNDALSFLNTLKKCDKCGKINCTAKNCFQKRQTLTKSPSQSSITKANTGIVQTNLHVDTLSQHDAEDDSFQLNFALNIINIKLPQVPPSAMVLANKTLIPKYWVLLDNQSKVHIFKNKKLVSNIQSVASGEGIRCYCNGGFQDTTQTANVEGVGEVWYNLSSLANILSFSKLSEKYRITADTANEQAFLVHKPNGSTMKFKLSDIGLYYYNTRKEEKDNEYLEKKPDKKNTALKKKDAVVMVQTVNNNMEGFTSQEIKGANEARRLYKIVGRPSYKDFKNLIKFNFLHNCPITPADINNAVKIYGLDIGSIKGKTVRKQPKDVVLQAPEQIPPLIREQLKKLVLAADIFYVNGVKIFTTTTRRLRFTTVQMIKDRKKSTILETMGKVIDMYKSHDITIQFIITDNEFEPLRNDLQQKYNIILNTTSANEHVPEIKREIRTIKEKLRGSRASLPFKIMPLLMVLVSCKYHVYWLNMFPRKNSLSNVYGPRIFMQQHFPDYRTMCKLEFGTYCKVHDDPNPSNNMTQRTTGAIALYPANNQQGGYYFMSVATGKLLSRFQWTELPIPDEVI